MAAAAVILVAGCGETQSDHADRSTTTDTASPSPSSSLGEPRSGTIKLDSGESVHYSCAGEGTPGVLLEAGTDSGGTESFPAAFLDPLIAKTTVCTYDRLGTGISDPAPHHRRTLRDLCAVQDQVIGALRLPTPYVLVGHSGGGNLDIGCADRHPERVAGLVTIDSYHDDPQDLRDQGFVWSDNPEDVDYIDYSKELDTLSMPIGDFPVLVISATEADPGAEKNQRYWLGLSPHSRQVVIEGPHDLPQVAPEAVVAEVLTLVRSQ